MKTYRKYLIDVHHCDASGNLKASHLLKFMQETSSVQLAQTSMAQPKLLEDNKSYVLCRLNMSIYKKVGPYSEIEISTWPCESSGLSFVRCYRARLDGNIVAEATTVWGIIDIQKRKFCRVSDFNLEIETDEPLELDSPSRIRIPQELTLGLVGERTVSYSDIDINGHMNNTVYPDMLCDFIPDMSKKRILMMGINYSSEVKEGENLKVYLGESDGQYYIRTLKSDGTVNCEAMFMVEALNPYNK